MLLLLTLYRRCDAAKLPGFHRPHIPYIFPKQFEQYYPNDTIKYAPNLAVASIGDCAMHFKYWPSFARTHVDMVRNSLGGASPKMCL